MKKLLKVLVIFMSLTVVSQQVNAQFLKKIKDKINSKIEKTNEGSDGNLKPVQEVKDGSAVIKYSLPKGNFVESKTEALGFRNGYHNETYYTNFVDTAFQLITYVNRNTEYMGLHLLNIPFKNITGFDRLTISGGVMLLELPLINSHKKYKYELNNRYETVEDFPYGKMSIYFGNMSKKSVAEFEKGVQSFLSTLKKHLTKEGIVDYNKNEAKIIAQLAAAKIELQNRINEDKIKEKKEQELKEYEAKMAREGKTTKAAGTYVTITLKSNTANKFEIEELPKDGTECTYQSYSFTKYGEIRKITFCEGSIVRIKGGKTLFTVSKSQSNSTENIAP